MRGKKVKRSVIKIDEELCTGCGRCASACHEGAIRMVNGKARLESESYCDGLGACIGECPAGALTLVEREAEVFTPEEAAHHSHGDGPPAASGSCPHSAPRVLGGAGSSAGGPGGAPAVNSALRNWPVQIRLIPENAPYLAGADLLFSADCVPFSLAGFHRELLAGKVLMVGCPKLDDAEEYREKIGRIFSSNEIRSVEVAYMEVPCCGGLVRLVREALEKSGKKIPCTLTKVSIEGEIMERCLLEQAGIV